MGRWSKYKWMWLRRPSRAPWLLPLPSVQPWAVDIYTATSNLLSAKRTFPLFKLAFLFLRPPAHHTPFNGLIATIVERKPLECIQRDPSGLAAEVRTEKGRWRPAGLHESNQTVTTAGQFYVYTFLVPAYVAVLFSQNMKVLSSRRCGWHISIMSYAFQNMMISSRLQKI